MSAAIAPKAIAVLTTRAEAVALIQRLEKTIAELNSLLAEETALVRDAKVGRAAPVAAAKSELSRRYMAELDCLKANAAFVRHAASDHIGKLQADNDALQQALEINLAVLATAHAVAEGIIRTVATAVEAKRAPSGYGANGKAAGQRPRAGAPLTVSRQL
ncbi:hypothetical protein [Phreatobacter stygius]|uniref:Flagellar protein FlgN n=1 Tax=Phreatobacter stygius TaxID=1940610 RepID=A0A4D7B4B4_9HYPH|nr:hypothetical protein [Phreatobacter stygius]QCI63012.1 hypothetical protein E8M01_01405 [Phreatobacter stygius]